MDQYKIIKKLGSGRQGTVFLAKDKSGLQVALKEIHCETDVEIQKAKEEIALVQRLKHPNMIKYYGCFETTQYDNFTRTDKKYIWIVMEYCNGTLEHFIHSRQKPIPEKTVKHWMEQILSALVYLHSLKIFHRDIKPENILFIKTEEPSGIDWVVKICDFGFTKHESDSRGSMVGTLAYMAPEVGREQSYDSKADIYSIWILFYQMFALKPVGRLENVSLRLEKNPNYTNEQLSNVQPVLKRIVYLSTLLDPKKRASATELLDILHKHKQLRQFLRSGEPRVLLDMHGKIVEVNHSAFHLFHCPNENDLHGMSINVLCPDIYSSLKDDYITKLKEPTNMIIQTMDDNIHSFRVVVEEDVENIKVSFQDIPDPNVVQDELLTQELGKIDDIYVNFKNIFNSSYKTLRKDLVNVNLDSEVVKTTLNDKWVLKKELNTEALALEDEILDEKVTKLLHSKHFHDFEKFLKDDIESLHACQFYHDVEKFKHGASLKKQKLIFKKYLGMHAPKRVPIMVCKLPDPDKFSPFAFDHVQYEILAHLRIDYQKYVEVFGDDFLDEYESGSATGSLFSQKTGLGGEMQSSEESPSQSQEQSINESVDTDDMSESLSSH